MKFSTSFKRFFIIAAALLLGLLASCSENKLQFASIDVTGAEFGRSFELTDHNGQVRSLKDFAGKIMVLFVGYTQCPDVCPTTMTELVEVRKLLGADGQKVQALFVTIDPERDTPEVLKNYMANFDPSFLALYTTPDKLTAFAKEFKIYYKKVNGKTPTSYVMEHTAFSYIYDTSGKLRLSARYGLGAPAMAADIRLLLK
jgi:protein SCO1/2